jgi:hypothetical protein
MEGENENSQVLFQRVLILQEQERDSDCVNGWRGCLGMLWYSLHDNASVLNSSNSMKLHKYAAEARQFA